MKTQHMVILYARTTLPFFDQFPCFCWYSKVLLNQTYFCYYVILCYFLFFCALLTFCLWCFLEPLQPGFIHSESFLIKVIYSSHITKSKIELQMFFFLGPSAALDHVDHILLENLFIWLFAYLTAYHLGLLCWFCSSLDYACWRAPGLLYTCKAFNTIHEVMIPKPDLFPLTLPCLISVSASPIKNISFPKAHQMQLTPSLICCSYLVIQSKKLGVVFKKSIYYG